MSEKRAARMRELAADFRANAANCDGPFSSTATMRTRRGNEELADLLETGALAVEQEWRPWEEVESVLGDLDAAIKKAMGAR